MAKSSSPFRFVSSNRTGQYSVWRGDEQVGYITKAVHTLNLRGMTRTVFAWTPTTADRRDLAVERTREAAARALWTARSSTR
ncbi:MAG TPA: hypothetical protein VLE97_11040 [Gaiellaceae bacterium]|nr:hypothetical protein [Gaiellaceae bacterium]